MTGLQDIEIAIKGIRSLVRKNDMPQAYKKLLGFMQLTLETVTLMGSATSTRGTDHTLAIFKVCDKFFNQNVHQKTKVHFSSHP